MLASQQQEYGDRSGYTRQRIMCESWIKHAYLSIAAAADILCTHSDMPVNGIYLGHLFFQIKGIISRYLYFPQSLDKQVDKRLLIHVK